LSGNLTEAGRNHAAYWDDLSAEYQSQTSISLTDFHYGPLLPGDRQLQLLPRPLEETTCLELGCGAGQNSIVLAKAGARCIGIDISERMLEHARRLAEQERVSSEFRKADLDALPTFGRQTFDLIHSAYGVPFAENPEQVIRTCADLLKPGGTLLFSMGHPVYAGEWLDLDGEEGLFLRDYFHPVPDAREGDRSEAVSRAYPVSEVAEWIVRAGLRLDRILEPPALPAHQLHLAPYTSYAWEEQAEELRRFPIVVIYRACKEHVPPSTPETEYDAPPS
jgi:SAM-dependent methyltransferase